MARVLRRAGGGIRVAVAGGGIPPSVKTAAERLAYYASQFPMVEVDATYYAPPVERITSAWAARTPDAFTFNVKAFSLLTGHPTKPGALPAGLRPATGKPHLYPRDLPAQAIEQVWEQFLGAMRPLVATGKLGVLLFQFPPWFTMRSANRDYLVEVARRCAPLRVAVELRHGSWFADDCAEQTLAFLRRKALPFVCVDMPQGYRSSVPPIAAATADLAVVRFHGRSQHWESHDIQQRYRYRYRPDELAGWVPRLRALSEATDRTFVVMNNCHGDDAQRNAGQLVDLLA